MSNPPAPLPFASQCWRTDRQVGRQVWLKAGEGGVDRLVEGGPATSTSLGGDHPENSGGGSGVPADVCVCV